MRALPFLLALLAGCDPSTTPPPGGTSVGNPGKNVFRVAPGTGLAYDSAFAVLAYELVTCDGNVEVPEFGAEQDLLASEASSFSGFEWCAVTVTLESLHVTGAASEGESFPFDLTFAPMPLTLWAAAPLSVDGESFVLELGAPGWISAEGLGLDLEPAFVEPSSDLHDQLVLPLLEGTAWYLDEDDDGLIAEDERAAGPVAATALAPPAAMSDGEPEDSGDAPDSLGLDGCNCATSPGRPLPWLAPLAPLALLPLRRRRR